MEESTIVLSHVQTAVLLEARRAGWDTAEASLDLGLTTVEVALNVEGVVLPDGRVLSWQRVEEIGDSERGCFAIEGGEQSL